MAVKGVTTQVALTTAAGLAKDANVGRKLLEIQNDATVDVLWGFSATTCYMRLQPGVSRLITSFSKVYAKTASSTGNLNVSEEAEQ